MWQRRLSELDAQPKRSGDGSLQRPTDTSRKPRRFGWLEVTRTASSVEFRILSGAYEDQVNTPILADVGPGAAVPEPGTWAAATLLALMLWPLR